MHRIAAIEAAQQSNKARWGKKKHINRKFFTSKPSGKWFISTQPQVVRAVESLRADLAGIIPLECLNEVHFIIRQSNDLYSEGTAVLRLHGITAVLLKTFPLLFLET